MFIDRIMINSFTQCTFFFFSFRLFIVFVRVYMRIPFTFRVFTRTKCTRLVVQFLLSNLRNYPRPFPFLFLFLYLVAMENYISLYIKKKKKNNWNESSSFRTSALNFETSHWPAAILRRFFVVFAWHEFYNTKWPRHNFFHGSVQMPKIEWYSSKFRWIYI